MKTSNKILLGLIVVVFALPLLLAATLKSKISKGEYVVKNHEDDEKRVRKTGTFSTFSVVKVTAPNPNVLRCNFKLSDQMNYNYNQYGSKDSVLVFTRNDTLFVQYQPDPTKKGEHDFFKVNINMPRFDSMVIDGAKVVIDSLPSTMGNLSIILQNNGSVTDGSPNKEKRSTKNANVIPVAVPEESTEAEPTDIIADGSKWIDELAGYDIKELLIYSLLYRI